MSQLNPYIVGKALRKRGFFGRQDMLKRVERQLHNPDINVLLFFGQRRIGKTSFLYQLEQGLPNDAFLPIYVDLQPLVNLSLGELLAYIADTIADEANLDPPNPNTFDDQGRFFRRTFLPQLHQELGPKRRLVFLLDEFDALEPVAPQAAAGALLPFLQILISKESWPAFVFMMGKGKQELLPHFTAIFRKAQQEDVLWVLDSESAQQLIRQAETNHTLEFTDQAVARILSLTSGHPYLTQLLCSSIWERYQIDNPEPTTRPRIARSHVEVCVKKALMSRESALIWWWNGLSPAEKIYAAALAESSVENEPFPKERVIQLAANDIQLPRGEIELAASALVKRQVLDVTRERKYLFTIELFRIWVQTEKNLQDVKYDLEAVYPPLEPLLVKSSHDIAHRGESHHLGHSSTESPSEAKVKSSSKAQEKASLEVGEQHKVVIGKTPPSDSKTSLNSPASSNDILSFSERTELVEHLLLIPSIADRDRRSTVIEQLRSEIKSNVRHSSVDKTDVFNILNTCLQYPLGMQNLRDILQFFEGDSIPMQRFKEALNRLLPRG